MCQDLKTQIQEADLTVAAILAEGVRNVNMGMPGIFHPESDVGERYNAAYKHWMSLRAKDGDRFALSLGY